MPRVKSNKIYQVGDDGTELKFSYIINVTTEGDFSTTLPSDVVEKFQEAKIRMDINRLRKPGYFSAPTLTELEDSVSSACHEYLSAELISESTVIRYCIETTCSYNLNTQGGIEPNGTWTDLKPYKWHGGTRTTHATAHNPYGFLVYAKPQIRKDYRYKSGREQTKYSRVSVPNYVLEMGDPQYYITRLNAFVGICEPKSGDIQEVEYTEENAAFFVGLLESICRMNERIKDFLDPESIKELVAAGAPLLGPGIK